MSDSQLGKVKKELQVLFQEFGLSLIIKFNKTTVKYLDIILNLLDGKYKPYQKPKKYTAIHSPRNIIWFNLPFSRSISTKIDHYFLNFCYAE